MLETQLYIKHILDQMTGLTFKAMALQEGPVIKRAQEITTNSLTLY